MGTEGYELVILKIFVYLLGCPQTHQNMGTLSKAQIRVCVLRGTGGTTDFRKDMKKFLGTHISVMTGKRIGSGAGVI